MTDEELKAIRARMKTRSGAPGWGDQAFGSLMGADVSALLAEVDRLRALLQPAMEELEAANSLADILPVLRAALGEPG